METSVSLLERLRTGSDEAAWQRLDDLYQPLIRRWLLRHPGLGDEAADIVQDVMEVLIRELPGFQRRGTALFAVGCAPSRFTAFWPTTAPRRNAPGRRGPP